MLQAGVEASKVKTETQNVRIDTTRQKVPKQIIKVTASLETLYIFDITNGRSTRKLLIFN